MNNSINLRHLPLWIARLANEGYTINIEYSKKLVRITCEGNTLRNLMPFGQTRLNEFGGWYGQNSSKFPNVLEGIIGELSDFRRALRGDDRAAFDSLMNKAREHASSCTVVPTLDPMHAFFISILVEQEKEINALKVAK